MTAAPTGKWICVACSFPCPAEDADYDDAAIGGLGSGPRYPLPAEPHLGGLPGDAKGLADLLPSGARPSSVVDDLALSLVEMGSQPGDVVNLPQPVVGLGLLVLGPAAIGKEGFVGLGEAAGHRVEQVGLRPVAHRLPVGGGPCALPAERGRCHGVKCGLTCGVCQAGLDVADDVFERPPWCGTCDEWTRKVEVEIDGRDAMQNCTRCHPLAVAS